MAKTIDECIDEIFKTQKNVGNKGAWRIKKTRFYKGELPDHGKQELLQRFGYVMLSEATYVKVEKPNRDGKDESCD